MESYFRLLEGTFQDMVIHLFRAMPNSDFPDSPHYWFLQTKEALDWHISKLAFEIDGMKNIGYLMIQGNDYFDRHPEIHKAELERTIKEKLLTPVESEVTFFTPDYYQAISSFLDTIDGQDVWNRLFNSAFLCYAGRYDILNEIISQKLLILNQK
jgi:hypothetical protein